MLWKRGNTIPLIFGPVKDQDGVTVPDLATATHLYFMVKEDEDDADLAALISRDETTMTVDSPSTGWITMTALTPAETILIIDAAKNYIALEIYYSATESYEIDLTENEQIINYILAQKKMIRK